MVLGFKSSRRKSSLRVAGLKARPEKLRFSLPTVLLLWGSIVLSGTVAVVAAPVSSDPVLLAQKKARNIEQNLKTALANEHITVRVIHQPFGFFTALVTGKLSSEEEIIAAERTARLFTLNMPCGGRASIHKVFFNFSLADSTPAPDPAPTAKPTATPCLTRLQRACKSWLSSALKAKKRAAAPDTRTVSILNW